MSDELLIKYIKGECSQKESKEVLLWIEQDADNKKYYKELLFVWTMCDFYAPEQKNKHNKHIWIGITSAAAACVLGLLWGLTQLFFTEANTVENYQALIEDIKGNEEITLKVNKTNNLSLKDSLALISYSNKQIIINDSTIVEEDKEQLNAIFVPYGKRSKIVLSDSTIVYLNSGSSLVYPTEFISQTREVYLDGEAYFDVTKNEKNKFIVRTAYKSIEVLGTQFNVISDKTIDFFQAVLVSGKISLKGNNDTIFMTPNQCYSYSGENSEEKLEIVDASDYIIWIKGKLKFDKTPLSLVLKKLEKVYNVRIVLKKTDLGNLLISGSLDMKKEIESILNTLFFTISPESNEVNYEIVKN